MATASLGGSELINAALVYERLGRHDDADHAYRLSLLTNRYTALAYRWPRPVRIGDETVPEQGATERELCGLIASAQRLLPPQPWPWVIERLLP